MFPPDSHLPGSLQPVPGATGAAVGRGPPALNTHPLVPVQPAAPGLPAAAGPHLRQAEIAAEAGQGGAGGGERWLEGGADAGFSWWMGGAEGLWVWGESGHGWGVEKGGGSVGGQRGPSSRRGCTGAVVCGGKGQWLLVRRGAKGPRFCTEV